VPASEHIEWQISDTKDKGIDYFRKVRDEIKREVEKLIQKAKETN
jgi:protein-tyrosine-phosphatase